MFVCRWQDFPFGVSCIEVLIPQINSYEVFPIADSQKEVVYGGTLGSIAQFQFNTYTPKEDNRQI